MKKLSEAGSILSRNQPQPNSDEGKRERQPEAQEALPKCNVNEKVQNKRNM